MMHDREKSHSAIVAAKPTNKAGSMPAAEPVEPRAGTKRNAGEQSTHRTLSRLRVTQALNRVRFAVGTVIAHRPPHRPVRAQLRHTVPTLSRRQLGLPKGERDLNHLPSVAPQKPT